MNDDSMQEQMNKMIKINEDQISRFSGSSTECLSDSFYKLTLLKFPVDFPTESDGKILHWNRTVVAGDMAYCWITVHQQFMYGDTANDQLGIELL